MLKALDIANKFLFGLLEIRCRYATNAYFAKLSDIGVVVEADVGFTGDGAVRNVLCNDKKVAGFGRVCAERGGWWVVVSG